MASAYVSGNAFYSIIKTPEGDSAIDRIGSVVSYSILTAVFAAKSPHAKQR